MAKLKTIDELEIGDKFLCLDWNKEPAILTVEEILLEDGLVLVEETMFDVSIEGGFYVINDEL